MSIPRQFYSPQEAGNRNIQSPGIHGKASGRTTPAQRSTPPGIQSAMNEAVASTCTFYQVTLSYRPVGCSSVVIKSTVRMAENLQTKSGDADEHYRFGNCNRIRA